VPIFLFFLSFNGPGQNDRKSELFMPKTKEDIAEETSKTRSSATDKYDASKIDKLEGL